MSEKKGYWQTFSAVDLMTIALFALLLRFVLLYIYKALYVVFPWNQALFPFFLNLCLATVLVMVRKGGTLLLWSVTWWLINLFLQGEDPVYAAGLIPCYLIAEAVAFLVKKYGYDLKSQLVVGTAYQLPIKIWDWWALNVLFLIPYPVMTAFLPVLVITVVVSGPIGIYLGYLFGGKLKEVVG